MSQGQHGEAGRHVTADALEAYVMGMLDDIEVAEVERHVSKCSVCEQALMREATLEMAFERVVRESGRRSERAPEPARRVAQLRSGAIAGGAVGAFAMAAAVILWVVPASTHGGVSSSFGAEVEANVGAQPYAQAGDAADDSRITDARDGG
jgi:hypothetical protein